jgi:hypothetical protein
VLLRCSKNKCHISQDLRRENFSDTAPFNHQVP